ncbi:MAG: hypothetical protein HQL32_05435 [Planctomycetes bacterium]|nr:hypothetical protein [Planctomycetota bacterium]
MLTFKKLLPLGVAGIFPLYANDIIEVELRQIKSIEELEQKIKEVERNKLKDEGVVSKLEWKQKSEGKYRRNSTHKLTPPLLKHKDLVPDHTFSERRNSRSHSHLEVKSNQDIIEESQVKRQHKITRPSQKGQASKKQDQARKSGVAEKQTKKLSWLPKKFTQRINRSYEPTSSSLYGKTNHSGLMGMLHLPSLADTHMPTDKSWSLKSETFLVKESYKGSDDQLYYHTDSLVWGERISLNYKLKNNWLIHGATGLESRSNQMLISDLQGGYIDAVDSVSLSLSDTSLLIGKSVETQYGSFIPHISTKIPTGSKSKRISSGHLDFSLGCSWRGPYVDADLSLNMPGDIDVGSFSLAADPFLSLDLAKSWKADTLSKLVNYDISPYVDHIAVQLHYTQSPFQDLGIPELSSDSVSLSALYTKSIQGIDIGLQSGFGLSKSAPAYDLGIILRF